MIGHYCVTIGLAMGLILRSTETGRRLVS
jgi:hypothetical protein